MGVQHLLSFHRVVWPPLNPLRLKEVFACNCGLEAVQRVLEGVEGGREVRELFSPTEGVVSRPGTDLTCFMSREDLFERPGSADDIRL